MKTLAILAGNFHEFRIYEKQHQYQYDRICYIDSPEKTRGLSFTKVIIVGTFWSNAKNPDKIHAAAMARIR